jgi:hypothetical protein
MICWRKIVIFQMKYLRNAQNYISMNLTQGQIQNFKLGGRRARQAQNLLGYFV